MCINFQTKFNGGRTCHRGDACYYKHVEVSKEEYDKMPKPWERLLSPGPSAPGSGPNSGAGTPTGQPKTYPAFTENGPDYNTFCRKCMDCPDKDTTCTKLHVRKEELEARIVKAKATAEKKNARGKKARPFSSQGREDVGGGASAGPITPQ